MGNKLWGRGNVGNRGEMQKEVGVGMGRVALGMMRRHRSLSRA